MKVVLKSSIGFPQDALLLGNNHIHDRLKQKENFGLHSTPKKYRDTASCNILSKRNGILHQKLIFAQPVKKSFFITKSKGCLPSLQQLASLCCPETHTSSLYCRNIFETHFNIILPSHLGTPSTLLLFRSSDYSLVCMTHNNYMCYMPSSSHSALFLHYNLLMCDKCMWD